MADDQPNFAVTNAPGSLHYRGPRKERSRPLGTAAVEAALVRLPTERIVAMMGRGGFDFAVAKEIRVEVFDASGETVWGWAEFTAELSDALAQVPAEHKTAVKVKLGGYYGESVNLEVSYTRPETDAEVMGRIDGYNKDIDYSEQTERANYLELKKKFEGG